MDKLRIGITVGDINGVGLEVILKTIVDKRLLNVCTPVVFGSSKVVSYHKNIVQIEDFQYQNLRPGEKIVPDRLNIVNCWQDNVAITLGKATETGGQYARLSLEKAMEALQGNLIDALVTAPINKKAMQMAGFDHVGHTEYLSKTYPGSRALMLMVGDNVRVGLATEHIPLSKVPAAITKERILEKIRAMHDTLVMDFGIERPSIAVLGLNPHAGDEGVIGHEEEQIIRPAIVEAKKSGILVMGPFPADGFFGSGKFSRYDGILAMYHDQGLAPFKALTFSSGVNYTAGLPIVRTSPDHGTAYDIAGQNVADPDSFRRAVFLAADVARNRREYMELRANRVQKVRLESEDENASAAVALPEE